MNTASQRQYHKAPITEAVIDLRVELSAETTVASLSTIQVDGYPTQEAMFLEQFQFAVGNPESSSVSHHEAGFRCRSTDGHNVYQARLDGFTMSRLAPYDNWGSFSTEARRLWNVYRQGAKPTRVQRLAVRYLNRIDVPLPLDDFGEYFRTVPQVSPDLSGGLSAYVMQLQMPLPELKSMAVINEILGAQQPRTDIVSVVLDIDIFRTEDVPTDEDEIWNFMNELRNVKNRIFEASITEKARELFQ